MESKNKGKKSLITCFKPIIGIHDSFPFPMRKRIASDPVLSYLAVANKDGAVLPVMLSSIIGVAKKCRKIKTGSQWPRLKAALNETTLMRMVVRRKKANKNKLSLSRSINNLEEISSDKISNPKYKSTHRTCSNVSTAFCSSSPLTTSYLSSNIYSVRTISNSTHKTLLPLSRARVTKKKQSGSVEDRNKGHHGSNIALCCMLSITLLILILWGKFLAILFTSMLLYLAPSSRRKGWNEGRSKNKLLLNKEVIMEGIKSSLAPSPQGIPPA